MENIYVLKIEEFTNVPWLKHSPFIIKKCHINRIKINFNHHTIVEDAHFKTAWTVNSLNFILQINIVVFIKKPKWKWVHKLKNHWVSIRKVTLKIWVETNPWNLKILSDPILMISWRKVWLHFPNKTSLVGAHKECLHSNQWEVINLFNFKLLNLLVKVVSTSMLVNIRKGKWKIEKKLNQNQRQSTNLKLLSPLSIVKTIWWRQSKKHPNHSKEINYLTNKFISN